MMFFDFLIFFCYFFWNLIAQVGLERNSGRKFFSLFLRLSQPGKDWNNVGMVFLKFLNFLGIFYLGSGRNGIRNKFFYLFLGLSHPGLDRNNVGMLFYYFLDLFAFFFGILYLGSGRNGIWIEILFYFIFLYFLYFIYIYFLSFCAYLSLVWIEITLEWCFSIFWIFLLFVLEVSIPGRVGTEFRMKIFFFPSRPISARFG